MNAFFSKHKKLIFFGLPIVILTLLTMFPLDYGILKRGSEFAVYIMIGLLMLGLSFMVFREEKLMFLALACCTTLCIFLKSASNGNFIFPQKNNLPNFSIAHINLSSLSNGVADLSNMIDQYDPDIISFQELTPDWDFLLNRILSQDYPSFHKLVRIDPYGMAIYTKFEIQHKDTFMFEGVPNLICNLNFEKDQIDLLSSYILPPLNNNARVQMRKHLKSISDKANEFDGPLVAFGDYNMVYWSDEIKGMRAETGLLNSRRNIAISRFRIPYDHIFYSQQLECIAFEEIEDKAFNHIGIFGQYQFNNAYKKGEF